jgi:prepilin-type N-terminal cleavage/methylation domain-containing protein
MRNSEGFTLVEMAMVLVIVGLLLGGLLAPLRAQLEQRRTSETKQGLEEIKEALFGYAISQTPPHLPCPDKTTVAGVGTANDGIEDFAATGLCVVAEGNIPWVTLGVAQSDSWGNNFHYRVSPAFSGRPLAATPTLASVGTLSVCSDTPCVTPLATGLPAVILSYGNNGWGAINRNGVALAAPTSANELANTDANDDFVSTIPSEVGSTNGEFDDLVSWLSPNILFSRLVAAGKLP